MTEKNYSHDAIKFAKKHGIKLAIIGDPEYKKHFADDTQERYVFKCRLSRAGRSYTFAFGQSINAGAEEPKMYDVLACLQKYDVGDFHNFCSEFGYDEDSRKAERIYKAVLREYNAMERIFGPDLLEEMAEQIQ